MKTDYRDVVWITGARRGIGAAVARELAAAGKRLALSARKAEDVKELGTELREHTDVGVFSCDVADRASVTDCAEAIADEFGRIDVLINNAGLGVFKPMLELTPDEFDAMIDVNLRGVHHCTRAVLPAMIERGRGDILTINSIAVQASFANCTAYGASKAGALAFNRSLRAEVREQGVRIMDIFPGATATAIWSDEMLQEFGERMMEPSDVAQAVREMLDTSRRAVVEELVLRPRRGDL